MRRAEKMLTFASKVILTLTACLLLPTSSQGAEPATFKFMQFGNCHAATDIPDSRAWGFAPSGNHSKAIASTSLKKHEPYLEVSLDSSVLFAGTYQSITVRLINGGDDPLQLEALDSYIYLIQEAQDRSGKWKPIEFLDTDCGNSIHQVTLNPLRYWEFTTPKYSGPRKTLLRFRLIVSQETSIYSEPFEGSIHTAQFKNKKRRS